jgi:hypothetical protein
LPGGKVGFAAPTGPVINRFAEFAVVGQPPDVRADAGLISEPGEGVMVRAPRLGAGAASATPPTSNPVPAVTAATKVPDKNRVKNFVLRTIQLISI